jgi:small-conductance mechanosensitive channel
MDAVWMTIKEFVTSVQASAYLRAAVILVVGVFLARIIRRRLPTRKLHPQHQLVLRRGLSYLVLGVTISWTLRELGVSLSVLIGAAGILTVAVGFASQTSASNLISGLFLMGEQPFVIGDIIRVGDTTGYVVSIDLLSVKLRTFDNLLVRIPNETMLKSNVTNLTHFPIRRVDLLVGVAYKEDIGRVKEVLFEVADKNPICLEEPRPLFIFLSYGDSSLNFQFSVWGTKDRFLDLRNAMYEQIKQAFDEHGIEIPFPHRTLYTGSVTDPLPVRLVTEGGARQR